MTVVSLAVSKLRPNDYNPNEMNSVEFAELVAEIEHLGHLPQNIIVRQDGTDYIIVDGEHGWRAAQKVGLAEVSCEIIDADDFEAMRQTYKRNQHGTHNPVRLGRMFRRMMDERDLSQRALADEIDISEGTIRNNLLYAKASDVRNGYAFDRLSVRELRAYLDMPQTIGDAWLDQTTSWQKPGTRMKMLEDALTIKRDIWNPVTGKREQPDLGPLSFQVLEDFGIADTFKNYAFVSWSHRAFRLWCWWQKYKSTIENLKPYVQIVARLGLAEYYLDRFLPVEAADDRKKPTWGKPNRKVLVSPEKWQSILDYAFEQGKNHDERESLIRAGCALALRQAGTPNVTDPHTVLMLHELTDAAPFVRDANLSVYDKWLFMRLFAELPIDAPEEVVSEAQRQAVAWGERRQEAMSGGEMGRMLEWLRYDPRSAYQKALEKAVSAWELEKRNALFADRSALTTKMVTTLKKAYLIREEKLGDRPAHEVLTERLDALPLPELKLLACYVLGDELAASGFWFNAVNDELGITDAKRYTIV